MPHPQFTGEEIERRGEELYRRQIRSLVETDYNLGKIVSIDIETGDYEIGDDLLQTVRRLQARRPDAAVWTRRIGFRAVYSLGGAKRRSAQ